MKKFVIKISLAFVIIAIVLLILLGLRSLDGGGTVPSYRFLGGPCHLLFTIHSTVLRARPELAEGTCLLFTIALSSLCPSW